MSGSATPEVVDLEAARARRRSAASRSVAAEQTLPVTGCGRIRLRTRKASSEWRRLGVSLEAATAALEAAGAARTDQLLDDWVSVARQILASKEATSADLVTLVRLAAVLAGCRPIVHPSGLTRENTNLEFVFAFLDWQAFRVSRDEH